MKVLIQNLFTQFCTLASMFLVWLAHGWLTEGFGLNPYISLPLATLYMALPHIMARWFYEDETEELSCIRLRTPSS